MSTTLRIPSLALACTLGFLALEAGCGGGASLPGAVYADVVPVYPGATYDGAMGGSTSEDIGGPAISDSMSWFFNVEDSVEDMVDFYQEQLPGARLEKDDVGDNTFTLIPEGAAEGEYVQVIVRNGQLQIHESLKPGRKQV